MGLTESVNNFDTKLNKITADIHKEVEKITGNPLEAEQKKLSNLIPFLRSISSFIAELEQTKEDLKKEKDKLQKTVEEYEDRARHIQMAFDENAKTQYGYITSPDDLTQIYLDIQNGNVFHKWNKEHLTSVWADDIYPQLSSTRGWRATLNGYYVLTAGKSYSSGEPVVVIEALGNPTTVDSYIPYAPKKELMTIE